MTVKVEFVLLRGTSKDRILFGTARFTMLRGPLRRWLLCTIGEHQAV